MKSFFTADDFKFLMRTPNDKQSIRNRALEIANEKAEALSTELNQLREALKKAESIIEGYAEGNYGCGDCMTVANEYWKGKK